MSVYLVFYKKFPVGSFKDHDSAKAAVLKYIGGDPHTINGEIYTAIHPGGPHGKVRYSLTIHEMKMGQLELTSHKTALM